MSNKSRTISVTIKNSTGTPSKLTIGQFGVLDQTGASKERIEELEKVVQKYKKYDSEQINIYSL